ncbi:MAG: prepilin-type N-terminal cleavage/methylation domain-containing protein [Desulfamplus sp.]|nr:prepilin-type N-terminal cleavage/methylation domain-containing protein [Desulfamplus sp.]
MKYSSKFPIGAKRNSKGFTLIEITVVIILVAIAGSLVLMNIGQSGRMKKSRMFASEMLSMCKKARITAITKGVPACLTISSESRECHIGFADEVISDPISNTVDDNSNTTDDNEESRSDSSSLKIPENILLEGENIKVDSNGVYYICFYPDGSSGGGILTISVENEFEFTFQVDMLTGSVREVIDSDS